LKFTHEQAGLVQPACYSTNCTYQPSQVGWLSDFMTIYIYYRHSERVIKY
jgi:hypothetical protein